MNRRLLVVAGIAVVLIAGLIMAYNQWWSPAARIRALIDKAAEAVADRDPQRVLEALAPDFEQDGMTKEKAGAALVLFYSEFDKVKVIMDDQKALVSGDVATDSIKVIVIVGRGGEQGYLLGQFGSPASLAVKLKRRGRWLITGVDGLPKY